MYSPLCSSLALYINDLPDHLPPDCTPLLYADDLAIAVQGLTVEEAEAKAQRAIDAVADWASEWRMQLAPEKCEIGRASCRERV